MPEGNKYTEAIKTLTMKTDAGEVTWTAYEPSEEEHKEGVEAKEGYLTVYKGKELRIYKRLTNKQAVNVAEFISGKAPLPSSDEETRMIETTVFKLKDPDTGGTWEFPEMSILDDLYSSVRQSSAGVQKWISDVLEEEK